MTDSWKNCVYRCSEADTAGNISVCQMPHFKVGEQDTFVGHPTFMVLWSLAATPRVKSALRGYLCARAILSRLYRLDKGSKRFWLFFGDGVHTRHWTERNASKKVRGDIRSVIAYIDIVRKFSTIACSSAVEFKNHCWTIPTPSVRRGTPPFSCRRRLHDSTSALMIV